LEPFFYCDELPGVSTPVAVTAGYITADARKELFGVMDATNIDLKGFTEDFYRTLCIAALRTCDYLITL
jgi:pyruvate-formate lyase-activating enzyme